MRVYAGREPQHDVLHDTAGPGQAVEQLHLAEVVHHDPADAVVQGHLQLFRPLVVAVEVDVFRGYCRRLGDCQLAARHHVEPQPFLAHQTAQRRVDERLRGVEDLAVRVPAAELADELPADLPQGRLVEHVERRAELGREVGRGAASQRQPVVGDAGRYRKEGGIREWHEQASTCDRTVLRGG